MAMQHGFGRSLSHEEFEVAFDQACEYASNAKCELEHFKLDLTKVACLMLEEGFDNTTFLHKSILEYYSAAFITHSMDEVASLFYSEVRKSPRHWLEVLSFLREIDPYRFARDFLVPELAEVRDILTKLTGTRRPGDLIAFVDAVFPDLKVMFTEPAETPGLAAPAFFGPFRPERRWAFKDLDGTLTTALAKQLEGRISANWLREIVASHQLATADGPRFALPIRVIAKELGDKELWIAMDNLLARVERELASAETLISDQQKRKLIFQKPRAELAAK
jgi:hypothetical protein